MKRSVSDVVAEEVMTDINVLATLVKLWVLCKLDSGLIVNMYFDRYVVKMDANVKVVDKVLDPDSFLNCFP
jgi:hypothetical protein